ncbi:MAG: hypothetical protein AAF675_02940 [Pseudomonadota bacterium]
MQTILTCPLTRPRVAILAAAAALLGTALMPVPANAQRMPGMVCGKRADIVADLERKFGETRRSYGLARQQGVVEIWASEKGSWTILLSRPGGIACLMAAGEAYEAEEGGSPETPA